MSVDRDHASSSFRGCGLDARELRVGVRRSQQHGKDRPRQLEIIRILTFARDKAIIFYTANRLTRAKLHLVFLDCSYRWKLEAAGSPAARRIQFR
jgi:hypothetical protein